MPYIGKSTTIGVRQRYMYTATASQTTFSGTDTQNLTLTYTDSNFVDVYLNGVLLKTGTDYTATSGTSVVLASGAVADDIVEIIVYDTFAVANFYNRTDSDSRYVNIDGDTMTGALTGTTATFSGLDVGTITTSTLASLRLKTAGSNNAVALNIEENSGNEGWGLGVNADGDLKFYNSGTGTSTGNSAVTFSDDDKVGIGTASPQQLLHVSANNPGGKIRLEMGQSGVADGDVTGEIQFYHNDSSGAGVNADIKGICTSAIGAGALTFGTGTTSTTERLRIGTSEAVFNEGSNDYDFRIESDGNSHGLFVDAGNDGVGIFNSADTDIANLAIGLTGTVISGDTDGATIGKGGIVQLCNGNNFGSSDATVFLLGGGTSGAVGQIASGFGFARHNLNNWGTQIKMYVHPADIADIDELHEAARVGPSEFVINETSNNYDFRIESDSNSNMFFVDAGNNRVSIGAQSSPQTLLHIKESSDTKTQVVLGHPSGGNEYGGFIRSLSSTVQGLELGGYFNGTLTNQMRIDANAIYFGTATSTSAPAYYFSPDSGGGSLNKFTDSTNSRTAFNFGNPNGTVGSIATSGSATAYNTSSDYRLKENVVTDWDATSRLKQLKPSRFNFKADKDTTVDGFLAHEVSSIVPEAITGTKDEVDEDGNAVMQGIDQSKLVPLLVKALQEAMTRIETLEAKVTKLEGE